jgi:hypothetical protein
MLNNECFQKQNSHLSFPSLEMTALEMFFPPKYSHLQPILITAITLKESLDYIQAHSRMVYIQAYARLESSFNMV